MRLLALFSLVSLGCAKTIEAAPGQPDGEGIVVTYYYLNF